jgi:hypothetical protein
MCTFLVLCSSLYLLNASGSDNHLRQSLIATSTAFATRFSRSTSRSRVSLAPDIHYAAPMCVAVTVCRYSFNVHTGAARVRITRQAPSRLGRMGYEVATLQLFRLACNRMLMIIQNRAVSEYCDLMKYILGATKHAPLGDPLASPIKFRFVSRSPRRTGPVSPSPQARRPHQKNSTNIVEVKYENAIMCL